MKRGLFVSVFGIIALFIAGCSDKSNEVPVVNEEVFVKHVEEISSDKFLGRKPASAGEEITINYLVEEFRKLGLVPMNGASYLQPIPLVEISPEYPKKLVIKGTNGSVNLDHAVDYVAVTKRIEDKVEVDSTEIVFAGYGIVAPEYGWNDYAGIDVKNKIVIVMVNDPGYATADKNLFTGRKMTYYGRWTYKYEEAARQGAAGILIIHEDGAASYPWAVVQNGRTGPQLVINDGKNNSSACKFEGWITSSKAKEIFALAGWNLDDELKSAAARGFKSKPMQLTTSLSMKNKLEFHNTHNVLGYIPGSKRPDEYVFFMGHWDHFGIDTTLTGDQIFNGAVDNATGVAGILAIADAVNKLEIKPERSIVFFAITLEEFGLLGSDFYVKHPLVPINKTVAAVNIDALNIFGPTKNFSAIGYGLSEVDDFINEEAEKINKKIIPESFPEAGSFFRSDHFNFAKVGIPAVYIGSGNEHMTEPEGFMQKAGSEWIKNNYHKVTDNYEPDKWNREGMMDQLNFVYRIGLNIANSDLFPNWNPDTPYRKIRDASIIK
ncbi:MAG TPA: M28 family metallopeptidase [Melioribacteraceae bacterium]|nr:M28 family metallopeptidase [Melioribacteraceae bacterium]